MLEAADYWRKNSFSSFSVWEDQGPRLERAQQYGGVMYRTNGYILDLRREGEAKLRLWRQVSLSLEPPFHKCCLPGACTQWWRDLPATPPSKVLPSSSSWGLSKISTHGPLLGHATYIQTPVGIFIFITLSHLGCHLYTDSVSTVTPSCTWDKWSLEKFL